MSFIPTFWNTKTEYNQSNRVSKVSGGQIAYKKKGYAWDYVDNNILSDLTATAFPGSVQFPSTAQGWLDIEFNGEYSAKRQVVENNWQSSEDAFVMRMRADTPTNSIGIINPAKPWQTIYYDAFGTGVNLIYGLWYGRLTRLEHVIEITQMPSGDSEYLEYDFYIESSDATTFVGTNHDQRPWSGNSGDGASVEGFSIFLAKGNDSSTSRGAVLRAPVCWWTKSDGSLVKKNIRVDFEIQPDRVTVKATKYIRRADIVEALLEGSVYRADVTFNPDPNPETTCSDAIMGYGTGSAMSWSAIRSASGNIADTSSATYDLILQAGVAANTYSQHRRAHFGFDTSSIGVGQSVDTASMSMYRKLSANFPNSTYEMDLTDNLYSSSPTSDTNPVAGDYANFGDVPYTDSPKTVTDETTSYTTQTYTFNADGIAAVDVDGITNIGLLFVQDAENATAGDPTHNSGRASGYIITMSESASNDPVLTITHSAASTGTLLQNNTIMLKDR